MMRSIVSREGKADFIHVGWGVVSLIPGVGVEILVVVTAVLSESVSSPVVIKGMTKTHSRRSRASYTMEESAVTVTR
jgi:hypothetical protein